MRIGVGLTIRSGRIEKIESPCSISSSLLKFCFSKRHVASIQVNNGNMVNTNAITLKNRDGLPSQPTDAKQEDTIAYPKGP